MQQQSVTFAGLPDEVKEILAEMLQQNLGGEIQSQPNNSSSQKQNSTQNFLTNLGEEIRNPLK